MKRLIFILITISFFASCKTGKELLTPISAQNQSWRIAFNADLSLTPYYIENGGVFLNDTFYQGTSAINEQLTQLKGKIEGIRFVGPIKQVMHDSLRYFDIGLFKDKGKDNHAYMIGWKNKNAWQKDIEIIYPFDDEAILPNMSIAEAREQWEKLSNSHDVRALIEQSYTSDAIYFSNGKLDEGTEAIIKRYNYMSNPNWQISLTPIQLLAVQENVVFEVGQYKSNGIGHYIIIWEKEESGIWKVRLDYNF